MVADEVSARRAIQARNTAIDYWRKHGRERGDETSLAAPIKPTPKQGSGGAAAAVEDSIAAPRHDEPEQILLRGLLVAALHQAIAELPKRQLDALRLRELIDYEVRRVNPDLIGDILDRKADISFTSHTTAFEAAKRTITRKLADKRGHEQLADLLTDLDICVSLEATRA